MARVYFKLSASDIRSAIKKRCTDPIIALSKNPDVMRLIAEKANEIVKPYVPIDSGALRESAHTIYHEKRVQLVWGDYIHRNRRGRPSAVYALIQYEADDTNWHRKDKKAESYWTRRIEPGTPGFKKLVRYAEPLVKKEVKNGNR